MGDAKKKAPTNDVMMRSITVPGPVVIMVAHIPGCPRATPGAPAAKTTGPSKVATDAYRSGWEGIFGAKPAGGPPS